MRRRFDVGETIEVPKKNTLEGKQFPSFSKEIAAAGLLFVASQGGVSEKGKPGHIQERNRSGLGGLLG